MNSRGFTLVEVLLSVIILGMLAGLSLPLYQSFQTRTDADSTQQQLAGMLRRAQVYARGTQLDSAWGVYISTGSATLYKGSSYASRDASYDETNTIPASYTVSGLGDVSFAKLSGAPSTTGTITLTIPTNETRMVTLNAKGMVAY